MSHLRVLSWPGGVCHGALDEERRAKAEIGAMRPPGRAGVAIGLLTAFGGPFGASAGASRGSSSDRVDCREHLLGEEGAWRVLPPGTEGKLRRAAAALGDAWALESAEVVCHEGRIRLAPKGGMGGGMGGGTGGGAVEVLLTDPRAGCRGEVSGAFCVVVTATGSAGVEVDAAAAAAIAGAFSTFPDEETWVALDEPKEEVGSRAPGEAGSAGDAGVELPPVAGGAESAGGSRPLWPYALAIGWFALPWSTGLAFAWLLRAALARPGPRRRRFRFGLALALSSLGVFAGAFEPRVPAWDAAGMGVVLALGFVYGSRLRAAERDVRTELRRAGLVVAGLAVGLAVAEAAVRIGLPPPRRFPPPEALSLVLRPEVREAACRDLYEGGPTSQALEDGERGRVVLHLGDSMVEGTTVSPDGVLTTLLDRLAPGTRHVNAAHAGAGPDYHLAMLRGRGEALRPAVVVLWIYAGNDLADLDKPYACCGAGPLLDAAGAWRCPEPRWRFPARALYARSPVPHPLRVLASSSAFAAHLAWTWAGLASWLEPALGGRPGEPVSEEAWARLRAVVRAFVAETGRLGARLVVVALPHRSTVEWEDPSAEIAHLVHLRVVETLREEGVPFLDPAALLRRAAREEGRTDLYAPFGPTEEHFGDPGHRLLAEWLAREAFGGGGVTGSPGL